MIRMTNKRAMALLAAGLLLPTLAGCSRSSEDPPVPVDNDAGVVENVPVEDEAPVMTNDAEPVETTNTAAEDTPPPPPPERTVDQQMMDDASATGMTSRVQRTPKDTPSEAPAEEAPKDGQ